MAPRIAIRRASSVLRSVARTSGTADLRRFNFCRTESVQPKLTGEPGGRVRLAKTIPAKAKLPGCKVYNMSALDHDRNHGRFERGVDGHEENVGGRRTCARMDSNARRDWWWPVAVQRAGYCAGAHADHRHAHLHRLRRKNKSRGIRGSAQRAGTRH